MAFRATVVLAFLCSVAAVSPLRKDDKLILATPLSKKVATELNTVAKVLQTGVQGLMHEKKNHSGVKKVVEQVTATKRKVEAVKKEGAVNKTEKDKKFPWWANASEAAKGKPNFTAVKANKSEKVDSRKEEKKVASKKDAKKVEAAKEEAKKDNKNATAAKKDANRTKKDKKFPWWANASEHMPNFTAAKKEVNKTIGKTEKTKKFPWWKNASDHMSNFSAVKSNKTKNSSEKQLPASLPKGVPQFTELGPFASKEAACDYCFTSHTRTSVVPNCICTAYDGDSGPTMFCTGTDGGLRFVREKGGCKCTENNPSAQGQTTCDPF